MTVLAGASIGQGRPPSRGCWFNQFAERTELGEPL